jgi:hypothetical protein
VPDPTDLNGIRDPRGGVDAAGNAIAVWADDDEIGQSEELLWSRKPSGGAWTAPAAIPPWIPSAPGQASREIRRNPVLVVAANGNAVAAWRAGPITGGFDVMASFYTPATGWSQPEHVWWKHPDTPTGADHLQISQDAAGNTMIVWEAGSGYIYYNRHSPTTGWKYDGGFNTVGHFINPVSSFGHDPRLAMNAAGDAVAIWRQGPFIVPVPDHDVWSSRYDAATDTWSAPQVLEDADSEVFGMNLVIDSAGVASAFWGHVEAARLHVRTSRLTANTWSAPSYLETDNTLTSGYAYGAQAVVDGTDDIMVVWQQGDTQVSQYFAKRYVAGTGWLPQQPIGEVPGSASPVFSMEFTVAGNAAGHVVVLWTLAGCVQAENVPCPVDVRANEYNPVNGEWGAEEVIDKEYEFPGEVGGDALTPWVAIAPSGNAVAVWDQDDGGTNDGIRSADFR